MGVNEKREWLMRKKAKEMANAKKKAAEMKAKLRELAVKKAAAEGKPPPEEEKEEEPDKTPEEPEEPDEPDEPEPKDEEPPVVELTVEEMSDRFFKNPIPDVTDYVMNTTFTKFSLPEKDEGFDSVRFLWSKEQEAGKYVKDWILAKKQNTRVEDVKPSEWFKKRVTSWNSTMVSWKGKHKEYQQKLQMKAATKAAKAAKKAALEKKAQLDAEKKEAEAKKAAEEVEAKHAAGNTAESGDKAEEDK